MTDTTNESISYDVVVVGGGPAGLATAIRLKQRAAARSVSLSVCVLEKAADFGEHTLSGAVLDPRALDELLPGWESEAPAGTVATRDDFYWLPSASAAIRLPHALIPSGLHNIGLRIVSLGELCRWLAERAAALDVDLLPGFAARELAVDGPGTVRGVVTVDRGVSRSGDRKPNYEPGITVFGGQTVLAEGSRGHLARRLIEDFGLDRDSDPQHYAIGFKEIWRVDASVHEPGAVMHGFGWPLSARASGGFFCYHGDDRRVAIGLVVDLNYANPYLSPYAEFQRLKQHPLMRQILETGNRLAYGARTITKGGLNSLPELAVPGAVIVGCDAGTLNFAKVKGIHTAMQSGIVAADEIFDAWQDNRLDGRKLTGYRERLLDNWAGEELRGARNVQPVLHRCGALVGGALVLVEQALFRGRAPWTLRDRVADHAATRLARESRPIAYPTPDGILSFDIPSSVYLSSTHHDDDQASHLTFKDQAVPIEFNLPEYASPEQRYCPAGVYEIVERGGRPHLQVNAQNCLHCKACDIKDPRQNIVWVPPEAGGPGYTNM